MAWRTTQEADEDIAELAEASALRFGMRHTNAYLTDLRAIFDLLSTQPHMARERSELTSRARLYPFRAHNIFYVVEGADIRIVRVLSHRQDWSHFL